MCTYFEYLRSHQPLYVLGSLCFNLFLVSFIKVIAFFLFSCMYFIE